MKNTVVRKEKMFFCRIFSVLLERLYVGLGVGGGVGSGVGGGVGIGVGGAGVGATTGVGGTVVVVALVVVVDVEVLGATLVDVVTTKSKQHSKRKQNEYHSNIKIQFSKRNQPKFQ